MEKFKEEGGETSLNCGTIRMITKRGEIVMEKRPNNRPTEIRPDIRPTENAMNTPRHEQNSADKPSLILNPPKIKKN